MTKRLEKTLVLLLVAAGSALLTTCSVGPQPGVPAWSTGFTPAARSWKPLPSSAGGTAFSPNGMDTPRIAVDSANIPYVAYRDWTSGGISVQTIVNGAWTFVGPQEFYPQVGGLSLAIAADDRPVVAIRDNASGLALVRKWDGSVWKPLGPPFDIVSGHHVQEVAIMVGGDGTLFCGFQDTDVGGAAAVVRYDQSSDSWQPVGPLGFTLGAAWPVRFALSPRTGLWALYGDSFYGSQVSVMNGDTKNGAWNYVGGAAFTGSTGQFFSISAGPDGDPVLGFLHDAIPDLVVLKLHDGQWKTVGTSSLGVGAVTAASFAVGAGGQVYAAFPDPPQGDAVTVLVYTGTGWSVLGTRGFTTTGVTDLAMTIDRTGAPVVAFQDAVNAARITVMSFR